MTWRALHARRYVQGSEWAPHRPRHYDDARAQREREKLVGTLGHLHSQADSGKTYGGQVERLLCLLVIADAWLSTYDVASIP